jgi:hypothetical protein
MALDWKDISGTVGKFAPMLGGLLGGPAGAAIGSVVASALGTGSTPDEVSQALTTNPDAAVKLRQIEADRTVKLQELVTQQALAALQAHTAELQSDAADRADARKMQANVRSFVPAVLAIGVTAGFFGVLGLLLSGTFKPTDNQALLILLGSLGASWGAIVNFYFGSSAGSHRQTELLAQAQPVKG